MRLFDAALAKANSQADAFLAPKHLAEAAQLYGLAANELRNRREAQAIAYAQQGLKASRRNSRCLQSVMNQEI
jgi:hypothetical protein